MTLLSAETMLIFLGLTVLGMCLLAVFFLCGRRMTLLEYLGWGLLAVILPLVGPFLVIVMAPGKPIPRVITRVTTRVITRTHRQPRLWRDLTKRLNLL